MATWKVDSSLEDSSHHVTCSGDSVIGSNPLQHVSPVGGLWRTDTRDYVLERSFHRNAQFYSFRSLLSQKLSKLCNFPVSALIGPS
jgi:hypothetical protein